jgi:hypothetical protein
MNELPGNLSGERHKNATAQPHFLRYILIGFFTLAPLWVTWLVLDFLFSLLAKAGAPFLRGLARALQPVSESLADWLLNPAVQYVLAALVTLAGFYAVGLLTSLEIDRFSGTSVQSCAAGAIDLRRHQTVPAKPAAGADVGSAGGVDCVSFAGHEGDRFCHQGDDRSG